jgi:threo-3-hydroxy-L-aspartate ammonia-lyase
MLPITGKRHYQVFASTARPTLLEAIRPTTVVQSRKLDASSGCSITIVSETFQHTGSFKFRAAYNLALNTEQETILTQSSGNFGQALAYACALLKKRCVVVMPSTSARVKIEAVRNFDGIVELTDTTVKTREQRLNELRSDYPDAAVASAYDDEHVIRGNASLGQEILNLGISFDYVVVPVGGGGLSAGIVKALERSTMAVIAAEPKMANDASRSFTSGQLVSNLMEPQTLADGARCLCLGKLNWQILKSGLHSVVEVTERSIAESVRRLFHESNLKVEPTGALSVGAVFSQPEFFAGKRVCCVVSGGNVDPALYAELIAPAP